MIGRRVARGGRPGLIGTAARTAVIAGTATAVSGRVANRQMENHAAQQQAAPQEEPAQPPASSSMDDEAVNQLERLSALFAQGHLTAEEFAAAKQRVLGG